MPDSGELTLATGRFCRLARLAGDTDSIVTVLEMAPAAFARARRPLRYFQRAPAQPPLDTCDSGAIILR